METASSPGDRHREVRDKIETGKIVVGDGETCKRYVLARSPGQAKRDREVREDHSPYRRKAARPRHLAGGQHTRPSCGLRSHPAYRRYLMQLRDGQSRLDGGRIKEGERAGGSNLIRSSDGTLPAAGVALVYEQLPDIEDALFILRQVGEVRPAHLRLEDPAVLKFPGAGWRYSRWGW
ncbi:MAG: hypothetical protein ACLFS8_00010 [Clostridia bacterium]